MRLTDFLLYKQNIKQKKKLEINLYIYQPLMSVDFKIVDLRLMSLSKQTNF